MITFREFIDYGILGLETFHYKGRVIGVKHTKNKVELELEHGIRLPLPVHLARMYCPPIGHFTTDDIVEIVMTKNPIDENGSRQIQSFKMLKK